MTSYFEGLSVVAIEAQASGVPCVFSDGMSTETKINDNVVFVPLSESATKWAEHVLRAFNLPRCVEQNKMQNRGFDLDKPNNDQLKLIEYFYE